MRNADTSTDVHTCFFLRKIFGTSAEPQLTPKEPSKIAADDTFIFFYFYLLKK